jgi:hypothetical protein
MFFDLDQTFIHSIALGLDDLIIFTVYDDSMVLYYLYG